MTPSHDRTGTTSVVHLLKRLGLEDREVQVYLALLPMKIGRVSAIAKVAKQPRTLTYVVLQNLEEKGLVSRIQKANVLHFVAEQPERLVSYAHQRKREYDEVEQLLSGALPFFHSMTSPLVGEPRVSLLKGLDGMKQVYREILIQDFVGLYNPEASYETFDENVVTMLFGPNATLRGRDLLVDNNGAKEYMKVVPQHKDYEIRLLPKGITFNTDTIVFGDTVAIFAFDEEKTIVKIENQHMADSFRAWFEVMWGESKKT